MRMRIVLAALPVLFLSSLPTSFALPPGQGKGGAGAIVLVFKDGHRQSFNLAEIQSIEFSGDTGVAAGDTHVPPRGRFVGKWVVGEGNGEDFTIVLNDDGSARRSLNDMHGAWVYVNGEAHITWDDGNHDAIRKVGSGFQKSWYAAGKSFTDDPDNVTNAECLTPKPS
jgi:hypothetical protein